MFSARCRVAGADDRRVAVRMRSVYRRINSARLMPAGRSSSSFRLRPNIVERRPLDFGVRAALRDAAADDDARTRLGCPRDQIVVFRGQAGIRNLKRVEHAQIDQARQMRQRTARGADEPDDALVAGIPQQVDQASAFERLGVAAMELQQVDVVGPQTPETGFDIPLDDVLCPDVVDFQVIFVLRVGAAALGREDRTRCAAN